MLRQYCEFSLPKLRWITMDYYMLNIIIAVFSLVVLSILIFENARISAGKKLLLRQIF